MTESEMQVALNNITSIQLARAFAAAGMMGQTSNSKRDRIYDEFGYPASLGFDDYYRAYDRNAIAAAAVDRTTDDCWVDYPEVFEGSKKQDKEGLSAWDETAAKILNECWPQLVETDRRNNVGRYAGVLLQVRDGLTWENPIDTAKIKSLGERGLVRLIPAWEAQLEVEEWETDITSDNYAQPKMYVYTSYEIGDEHTNAPAIITSVHPSRVIVLAEGSADGLLTSGRPLLRKGFNKILDAEKVSGGSAEGFLKNASRQLSYNFSKETNFKKLAAALGVAENNLAEGLNEQVSRLNRSVDAASFMQEGQAQVLSVTPADPEPTWRTALSEFCASIKIPVKVLIGQFTGERASTEDSKTWARVCNSRRHNVLTPFIKNVVMRFIEVGILQPIANDEITVSWSDLLAPSTEEKINNMEKMASVADKTRSAYGRPVVKENEIRMVGELETLKEYDNELEPPKPGEKNTNEDPLTDDREDRNANNPPQ